MFSLFSKSKKVDVQPDLIEEYKKLCVQAAKILNDAGKSIKPYNDEDFSRLKASKDPKRVVENLNVYVSVLTESLSAGESLDDDKKIIWRMVQKLGLRPAADLMERIESNHTICIYTVDNLLIFYNLDFFDHIHATVDEVATIVWDQDSQRKMSVTTEALRLIFLIKTKQLRNTFIATTIPKHTATFRFSETDQKIEVDIKLASPLHRKDGLSAYLVMQKTKRLY